MNFLAVKHRIKFWTLPFSRASIWSCEKDVLFLWSFRFSWSRIWVSSDSSPLELTDMVLSPVSACGHSEEKRQWTLVSVQQLWFKRSALSFTCGSKGATFWFSGWYNTNLHPLFTFCFKPISWFLLLFEIVSEGVWTTGPQTIVWSDQMNISSTLSSECCRKILFYFF